MVDISASGTDIQIATDAGFSTCLVDDNSSLCGSRTFGKTDLPYGVNLYARVRHLHPETGVSFWSSPVNFRLIIPGDIIGVCLDNSGTRGTFYWIDALGNRVTTFDYQMHPIFDAISMVTMDLRSPVTLTRIPLFYVKTATVGPAGTFAAGKKCWWISDHPAVGFRPAACFKRTMLKDENGKYIISPYCYIGTYIGHIENVAGVNTIGSRAGMTAATNEWKDDFKFHIKNRNDPNAGISGFRMFDIWDMGAIRLLALIAKASANSQLTFGDNSNGIVYPTSGSTNSRIIFKGNQSSPLVTIEDMWRCFWYFVDLISVSNGYVSLTNPMDTQSPISFGSAASSRYRQPTSSGWIKDILDCPFALGDDTHDLMELFLPKTVNRSESKGTFFDYHDASTFSSTTDVVAGGCPWNLRNIPVTGCGMFRTQFFSTVYPDAQLEGVRICKN